MQCFLQACHHLQIFAFVVIYGVRLADERLLECLESRAAVLDGHELSLGVSRSYFTSSQRVESPSQYFASFHALLLVEDLPVRRVWHFSSRGFAFVVVIDVNLQILYLCVQRAKLEALDLQGLVLPESCAALAFGQVALAVQHWSTEIIGPAAPVLAVAWAEELGSLGDVPVPAVLYGVLISAPSAGMLLNQNLRVRVQFAGAAFVRIGRFLACFWVASRVDDGRKVASDGRRIDAVRPLILHDELVCINERAYRAVDDLLVRLDFAFSGDTCDDLRYVLKLVDLPHRRVVGLVIRLTHALCLSSGKVLDGAMEGHF